MRKRGAKCSKSKQNEGKRRKVLKKEKKKTSKEGHSIHWYKQTYDNFTF